MSNSSILYRLQQIDSQLDQASSRIQEIEILLNDSTLIDEAKAKASQAEKVLNDHKKNLRIVENQVSDQKFKMEQNESTLYGGRIRNPKELQDLQNEAASLKRYLGVLEDRQLEIMLEVEDQELEFTQANNLVLEITGRFEEEHAHLRAEKTRLNQELEKLLMERKAAADSADVDDLKIYDHLRLSRNGVAVTRVVDQSCAACGSTLTPGLAQSARSINQLNRCTSCSRILYAG